MDKTVKKYPTWRKWFFGAGDTAATLSHTIISFFFLIYLTDVIGIRPALAGSVVLIGKIWDAVTDPLVGHISDNTRSRLGRRRFYLATFALPLGISFFFLWALPQGMSETGVFILASLAFMLHMTFVTLVMVPYQAILLEMVDDYDQRTSFTAYRMLFSILGGLLAVAIPDIIVGGYADKYKGFMLMAVIFAVIIAIAPLFPFFGTYEKQREVQRQKFPGFKTYLKPIFSNVPFRLSILIYFFTWSGIAMVEAMFMYFFTYWLRREDLFLIIVATLFILAAVFLPIWVRISEKLEKRTAYMIGILELAISLILVIFIKPDTPVWMIFALVVFLALGVSAAHVMPHTLIPDCIDYGTMVSGKRTEGVYYGLVTFFYKMGVAVVIWISGLVLDFTGYINPEVYGEAVQPYSALLAIRVMQGPAPAVILLMGVMFIILYPISRNKHRAITRRLAKREEA
ncbi:MAG TPA: MFS transporter [Clostridia bacterium]|nr:MFS transporter [Clostridia bacterium]